MKRGKDKTCGHPTISTDGQDFINYWSLASCASNGVFKTGLLGCLGIWHDWYSAYLVRVTPWDGIRWWNSKLTAIPKKLVLHWRPNFNTKADSDDDETIESDYLFTHRNSKAPVFKWDEVGALLETNEPSKPTSLRRTCNRVLTDNVNGTIPSMWLTSNNNHHLPLFQHRFRCESTNLQVSFILPLLVDLI